MIQQSRLRRLLGRTLVLLTMSTAIAVSIPSLAHAATPASITITSGPVNTHASAGVPPTVAARANNCIVYTAVVKDAGNNPVQGVILHIDLISNVAGDIVNFCGGASVAARRAQVHAGNPMAPNPSGNSQTAAGGATGLTGLLDIPTDIAGAVSFGVSDNESNGSAGPFSTLTVSAFVDQGAPPEANGTAPAVDTANDVFQTFQVTVDPSVNGAGVILATNIAATPTSQTLPTGDKHHVIVTALNAQSDPMPGVTILFNSSGPNIGTNTATVWCVTDFSGTCSNLTAGGFGALTGGLAGIDSFTFWIDNDADGDTRPDSGHPPTPIIEPQIPVTVTWVAAQFGSKFVVTCDDDLTRRTENSLVALTGCNRLTTEHTVTFTAAVRTIDNAAEANVKVFFAITGISIPALPIGTGAQTCQTFDSTKFLPNHGQLNPNPGINETDHCNDIGLVGNTDKGVTPQVNAVTPSNGSGRTFTFFCVTGATGKCQVTLENLNPSSVTPTVNDVVTTSFSIGTSSGAAVQALPSLWGTAGRAFFVFATPWANVAQTGGTTTINVLVADAGGNPISGDTIQFATTGASRNSFVVTRTSNAAGQTSFTYGDLGPGGSGGIDCVGVTDTTQVPPVGQVLGSTVNCAGQNEVDWVAEAATATQTLVDMGPGPSLVTSLAGALDGTDTAGASMASAGGTGHTMPNRATSNPNACVPPSATGAGVACWDQKNPAGSAFASGVPVTNPNGNPNPLSFGSSAVDSSGHVLFGHNQTFTTTGPGEFTDLVSAVLNSFGFTNLPPTLGTSVAIPVGTTPLFVGNGGIFGSGPVFFPISAGYSLGFVQAASGGLETLTDTIDGVSDNGYIKWASNFAARNLDCSATSPNGGNVNVPSGSTAVVRCTVFDVSHQPVAGWDSVEFKWAGVGQPGVLTAPGGTPVDFCSGGQDCWADGDNNGQFFFPIKTAAGETGTSTMTVTINYGDGGGTSEPVASSECNRGAANPVGSSAGNCTWTLTIHWGAPSSGAATALTLGGSPRLATFGALRTFSGTMTSGGQPVSSVTITILRRALNTGSFTEIGHAITNSSGNYTFTNITPSNSDYLTTFAGAPNLAATQSNVLRMWVRRGVALRASTSHAAIGKVIVLTGRVVPQALGERVKLVVLTPAGWHTVAIATLRGLYLHFNILCNRASSAVYRLLYPTQDVNYVWNFSAWVRVSCG